MGLVAIMKKAIVLLTLAVALLLLASCRFSPAPTPTPVPAATPPPQAAGGDLVLTLNRIINPYDPERSELSPPRGFKLVRFVVTLANQGKNPLVVDALNFVLEDEAGSFSYGQGFFEVPLGLVHTLAPGASLQAVVTFPVAQGRSPARLKYIMATSPTPQVLTLPLK